MVTKHSPPDVLTHHSKNVWLSIYFRIWGSRSTISVTGLRKRVKPPGLMTLTSTWRTFPSWLGKVCVTSPRGHSFRGTWLFLRRTTLPGLTFGWTDCHFLRACRVGRNCFRHLSQNVLERCWTCRHWHLYRSATPNSPAGAATEFTFCVRRTDGVSMNDSSGSVVTGTRAWHW